MVILVDEQDNPLGSMEKLMAHQKGVLHRAFSIFIFNSCGDLLLQQRAKSKYHSAGLWSNSCCGHPLPGEETIDAANRRLHEEFGIQTSLKLLFSFQYNVALENGLTENEFDHVYFGISDAHPVPDSEEIETWKYMNTADLRDMISTNDKDFTCWFKLCVERVLLSSEVVGIIGNR